jgi:GNAT superfamily N-acetyltransferase
MAAAANVRVRDARENDREFVLDTARRLAEFGPPPWRMAEEIIAGESRAIRAFFEGRREGAALLVAESPDGRPLGFAYLETQIDFFTQRPHGHLAELAVAREAEGTGTAGALLTAAEDWARARGHFVLTLNVFDGNRHAREVYARRGFSPETIRYIKSVG